MIAEIHHHDFCNFLRVGFGYGSGIRKLLIFFNHKFPFSSRPQGDAANVNLPQRAYTYPSHLCRYFLKYVYPFPI